MTSRLPLETLLLWLVMLSFLPFSLSAESGPPHQEALQPYVNAPPQLLLSQGDHEALNRDDPVFKTFNPGDGNRTAIVFRVAAPAPVIWSVIADFDAYPKWMKMVKETEVYKREKDDIYVRFRISHWLLGDYTYHMRHTFPWQEKGWGKWQLDNARVSDFSAAIGFWQVRPVAGSRDQSDVIYAADLRFKNAKLRWLRRFVVKRSLKQATHWVKAQAEARWRDR